MFMDCLASLDHFSIRGCPVQPLPDQVASPTVMEPVLAVQRICYFALLDLGVSIGGGVAEIIAPEADDSVHICVADPCIKGMGVSRLVIRKICQGLPILPRWLWNLCKGRALWIPTQAGEKLAGFAIAAFTSARESACSILSPLSPEVAATMETVLADSLIFPTSRAAPKTVRAAAPRIPPVRSCFFIRFFSFKLPLSFPYFSFHTVNRFHFIKAEKTF